MAAAVSSNQWGHSVPFDDIDNKPRPRAKRQNTHGSQLSDYRSTRSVTPRTSDLGVGIQSDSEETRQRRRSLKAGNSGARRKQPRKSPHGQGDEDRYGNEEHLDDSAWIHRDKLEEIEKQEMVEAGYSVRQPRRSLSAGPGASTRSSRSVSRPRKVADGEQSKSSSPVEDEYISGGASGYDDYGRKRVSTIDQAAEEDEHTMEYASATVQPLSPRTGQRDSASPTSTQRPGTSRIPVSTSPSVPVPQNVIDRETPLPRSRHGSGAMSGNWDELRYRHARSNSAASQVLLDDDGLHTPPRLRSSHKTSSNENSPPKARMPNKAAPSARKGSGTAARPGSSAGRKTGATQRSTSRTTDNRSRPAPTSQYPREGDPPWISNMYKPDPRLPPDQQMLPTHARRLAQEQWEREGKTGTAYDRDLRLLNDKEFPPPPPSSSHQAEPATQKATTPSPSPSADGPHTAAPPLTLDVQNFSDLATKPLPDQPTALSPRSQTGSVARSPDRLEAAAGAQQARSGTPGGYRITPTIAPVPPIQRSSTAYSQHANTIRTQNLVTEKTAGPGAEEEKGSKGCGCCVMM